MIPPRCQLQWRFLNTGIARVPRPYSSAMSVNTNARFFSSSSSNSNARPPVALIFDTETTGKVNFKKSHEDPSQPDLVQLGMILVDTFTWKKRLQVSLLIQDVKKEISPEAEAIHGILKANCQGFGVSLTTALQLFHEAHCWMYEIKYCEILTDRQKK